MKKPKHKITKRLISMILVLIMASSGFVIHSALGEESYGAHDPSQETDYAYDTYDLPNYYELYEPTVPEKEGVEEKLFDLPLQQMVLEATHGAVLPLLSAPPNFYPASPFSPALMPRITIDSDAPDYRDMVFGETLTYTVRVFNPNATYAGFDFWVDIWLSTGLLNADWANKTVTVNGTPFPIIYSDQWPGLHNGVMGTWFSLNLDLPANSTVYIHIEAEITAGMVSGSDITIAGRADLFGPHPSFELEKAANVTTASVNDIVEYTIEVKNTCFFSWGIFGSQVRVVDILDTDFVSLVPNSISLSNLNMDPAPGSTPGQASYNFDQATGTITVTIPRLLAHEVLVITYEVEVLAAANNNTIHNTATLSSSSDGGINWINIDSCFVNIPVGVAPPPPPPPPPDPPITLPPPTEEVEPEPEEEPEPPPVTPPVTPPPTPPVTPPSPPEEEVEPEPEEEEEDATEQEPEAELEHEPEVDNDDSYEPYVPTLPDDATPPSDDDTPWYQGYYVEDLIERGYRPNDFADTESNPFFSIPFRGTISVEELEELGFTADDFGDNEGNPFNAPRQTTYTTTYVVDTNPLTSDGFNVIWLVVAATGFSLSAFGLIYLAKKRSKV